MWLGPLSGRLLVLGQVMISGFLSSGPALGSVRTVWSLLGILSPSFSAAPLLSLLKSIRKEKKKRREEKRRMKRRREKKRRKEKKGKEKAGLKLLDRVCAAQGSNEDKPVDIPLSFSILGSVWM